MSSKKSVMGRRKFLITAGVASVAAPAIKNLAGLVDSSLQTGIAIAADSPASAAKASDSSKSASAKGITKPKCVVIYFSLTGSTEKIAKAIQKGVEQAAGNCDIFPIKGANPRLLGNYDLIAFGNPLMGRNLKLAVSNFIRDLCYVGGKHLFVFSTSHSGDNNFATLIPAMKAKGLITIGSKGWQGSVYGPLGEPCPAASDGHPDKIDLEEAEAFGKEMVEKSRKIYAGDKSLIPPDPAPPVFSTRVPELVGLEKLSLEDYQKAIHFHLTYDQTKCLYPTCKRCVDFCQVYGIDMTVEPRIIGNPCMNCMMCDQVCPTGAITVDDDQMKWQAEIEHYSEKAQNAKARLEEMKQRKQNMPAGSTKRRQYVSDEKVAEGYSHQVYQVFNKRPRFVVGYGRPYGIDPATQEDRGPAKGV
jgi:flavodoxin/Fe-S-cluster-containing hydrogenase component 2